MEPTKCRALDPSACFPPCMPQTVLRTGRRRWLAVAVEILVQDYPHHVPLDEAE